MNSTIIDQTRWRIFSFLPLLVILLTIPLLSPLDSYIYQDNWNNNPEFWAIALLYICLIAFSLILETYRYNYATSSKLIFDFEENQISFSGPYPDSDSFTLYQWALVISLFIIGMFLIEMDEQFCWIYCLFWISIFKIISI